MKYLYPLPEHLVSQAVLLQEFANGAAQCHVQLQSGTSFPGVLISNANAIIAMRSHVSLPFAVSAIDRLFQTAEDASPTDRADWKYFDDWRSGEPLSNSTP